MTKPRDDRSLRIATVLLRKTDRWVALYANSLRAKIKPRNMYETQDISALLWYNKFIDKSALQTEELEKLPKEMLVALCSGLSENFRILAA